MKRCFNKILSLFLVSVMLVAMTLCGNQLGFISKSSAAETLAATGQCGDNVYWEFDESTGSLTITGSGDMEDYYTNFPFYNGIIDPKFEIKSIYIDSGVTSIGDRAFTCCEITSISIPSSITSIGDCAFLCCDGITSVEIPSSVTNIKGNPFQACFGLKKIVVDANNTYYDSRDNCNAIINSSTNELVSGCMNTKIPSTVTSIGDKAFWGCDGLTSITIPNSISSIGDSAFYGCNDLTSITIPNSVTSIGDEAFESCSSSLEKIIVDSNNQYYDSRDNCNAIINSSTNELILGCKNTKIPDTVTSIGVNAFWACDLTSITIPSSVTSIGDGAFESCHDLTSITIPNSVTSIGDGAFEYCDGLIYVGLGNGVTYIDKNAFSCPSIESSVSDVYYSGTEDDWNHLAIEQEGNEALINATIHYNSDGIPDEVLEKLKEQNNEQYDEQIYYNNFPTVLIIIIIAVVLVVAAVIVILILRKKKKNKAANTQV